MEPFTALVGLLPLAESAVKITSRLCKTISEVKGLPGSLRQELDWLIHLRKILVRFEGTCRQLDYIETGVEIDLLRTCLKTCESLVKNLEEEIDERLIKIKGKSFRSRIEALRAVFDSEDLQRSKSEIDRCTKDLNLAYQDVSSQTSIQHYKRTMRIEKDVILMNQSLKSFMGTYARTLDKINGDHGLTVTNQQGIFTIAQELLANDPRPSEWEYSYRSLIDNCQEAHGTTQESVFGFPIDTNHAIDPSVSLYQTIAPSLPLNSVCRPPRKWHGSLDIMKPLVDAGARLQYLYEDMFRSILKHPYKEALATIAVYQNSSKITSTSTVRRDIGLDAVLKPFRDGLYTHAGPLDVKRWTSQLVNVALHCQLNLGTDLNSGVLYFDGPFKYSIWFDECYSESPASSSVPSFSCWYDELKSRAKFTYFKEWFDELIRYDTRQERDNPPHSGPCVEKYLEPTRQALFGGHLSPWLSALMDADIDVFEVARQTYALATGQEAAFFVEQVQIAVFHTIFPSPRNYMLPSYCSRIRTTEDLKQTMLAAFKENGMDMTVADKSQNIDVVSLSLLRLILLALATLTRNWKTDYVWQKDRRHAKET